MQFEEIMDLIRDGLTGEAEHDLPYLKDQMEKYKEHELAREILRECGRITYELLPADKKAELEEAAKKDDLGLDEQLEKAEFYLYKKDFDKAIEIIEPLAEKLDMLTAAEAFQNDSVSEYYCFTELFQEILQHQLSGSKKTFRNAPIPFAKVYNRYGIVLVDLKRYEEAGRTLEKSLRWNPIDADTMFEYAETFKLRGDLEKFFEVTKDAFRIAYRPVSVARCYRNLGYYFSEKRLWDVAAACIIMSTQYVPNDKNAQSELYYIEHMSGKRIKNPDFDEFRKYAGEYGFPVGADDDILGLAAQFGKHFLNEGRNDMAEYFLTIFYELTDDEQVKAILEQISYDETEK